MTITELCAEQTQWVRDMGWGNDRPLEYLALIASEVGEAVNECRGEKPTDKLPHELADIILRTIGMAGLLGIDIEKAIAEKIAINFKRGNRGRIK